MAKNFIEVKIQKRKIPLLLQSGSVPYLKTAKFLNYDVYVYMLHWCFKTDCFRHPKFHIPLTLPSPHISLSLKITSMHL